MHCDLRDFTRLERRYSQRISGEKKALEAANPAFWVQIWYL